MAINLAAKYSPVVDERFSLSSVTNIAFNSDYDWNGVDTVNVYSIDTAPMGNYTRTGLNRFGTPVELGDSVQTMQLTRDRAFSFTVDRGNNQEQMYVKAAGQALGRQIAEVVVPEVDTYRISILSANTGASVQTTATATNAYKLFLDGQETLGNAKVPVAGRIAYVSYAYYNLLKLDQSFVRSGDVSQGMLVNGIMGMVDNVPIIPVPDTLLPGKLQFLLLHPIAGVAPITLSEFRIHENPPGVSGWLVEGRVIYDTFVLDSKRNAIYLSESV